MKGLCLALVSCVLLGGICAAQAAAPRKWLAASGEQLPPWRGFNLLNKFNKGSAGPFEEEDFRLISELGFNFVRLPMDYRAWIKDGDWRQFDEAVLREIDQALAWGEQYGIHVCINFHRAPGYTVATPKEPKDLWTDPEALEVCALHWATFAKRYKGIPSERLSFNLLNEPGSVGDATYARVAGKLVDAIRAEDPGRLIIADGPDYGRRPCMGLLDMHIAQATRGYTPMDISHYKASWINGSDTWREPSWPAPVAPGFLYGTMKPELKSPLRLDMNVPGPGRLRIHVGDVSSYGRLVVKGDGTVLFDKALPCGEGAGEWREAHYQEAYGNWRNTYDRDYWVDIPAGVKQVTLENSEGDWFTLTELGYASSGTGGEEAAMGLAATWGEKAPRLQLSQAGAHLRFTGENEMDRAWLYGQCIAPWKEFEEKGGGVIVGEWGAFNCTPHDTVLRWMEDSLKNWQEAGWGWALWNFQGSFGILDSGRKDVDYEDWRGHKLDRAMLELLSRY